MSATATAGGPVELPQPKVISISSPLVAVNSQAYINGEGFAPAGTSRALGLSELVEGRLPETLNGVCVLVAGIPAPIFSVTPARLGIIVPAVESGAVAIQVIAACGGTEERKSNEDTITVQATSPEFFYAGGEENGLRPVLIRDVDGVRISGAPAGSTVVLTLTGLGATDPATVPGVVSNSPLIEAPQVTIGGSALAAEDIAFAGTSASFPGIYELRIKVPAALPAGDHPIVVTAGGVTTAEGAALAVTGSSSQ
jgi:uncharacterized protein (TIGR03437 family)